MELPGVAALPGVEVVAPTSLAAEVGVPAGDRPLLPGVASLLRLDYVSQPCPPSQPLPLDLPFFPVMPQPGPVGARLRHYWRNWQVIQADEWVLSVLREGLILDFKESVALTRDPVYYPLPSSPLKSAALVAEVQRLLDKEVVCPVVLPHSPGFYSHIFVVAKPQPGKWRLVINLKELNRHLVVPHFKMETVASLLASILPNQWAFSLDLTDAYLHVPMHPSTFKYLRFNVGEKLFHFRALPFGLSTSPLVFTKVMAAVGAYAHQHAISLHLYLDDWLARHFCREQLLLQRDFLLKLLPYLGLQVNLEKSELVPTQAFTFIGVSYDLRRGLFFPPHARWLKVCHLVDEVLHSGQVSLRTWLRLLGLLGSAQSLVPQGRLRLRPLQMLLRSQHVDRKDLSALVKVTQGCVRHLLWWVQEENFFRGLPLAPFNPTRHLFTDASGEGWGAHLDFQTVRGIWSPSQATRHINWLELMAAWLAMQHFLPSLQGQHVLLATDNAVVVAYINKHGGPKSRPMTGLVWKVLLWCWDHDIQLRARHIPGSLNVLADSLSRPDQPIPTEWSLHQGVVDRICQVWGSPQIDLFATRFNRKFQLFVSPIPDETALAVDALSMSWRGLRAYAYPPLALLTKVVRKVREAPCELFLVAPAWPNRSWFPDLLELSVDWPLRLPLWPGLLSQPGGLFHHNLSWLSLHVWRLSAEPTAREAFRLRCRRGWPPLSGSPHLLPTRASGQSSWLGVVSGASIHSLPLFL